MNRSGPELLTWRPEAANDGTYSEDCPEEHPSAWKPKGRSDAQRLPGTNCPEATTAAAAADAGMTQEANSLNDSKQKKLHTPAEVTDVPDEGAVGQGMESECPGPEKALGQEDEPPGSRGDGVTKMRDGGRGYTRERVFPTIMSVIPANVVFWVSCQACGERRGGGRSMDEGHTELDITKGLATAEHTLWDVGFLSHLEHAAGPVTDPFPDPLPGPFPDPPGRGFSGPCDRSQIARTHTALRPWQVPMGFEMAGFPPAIYRP